MTQDYKDPYLVVGTGRSGTSTVARILHEKLDVCMGYAFFPANDQNPDGYYEDSEFVQLNHQFTRLNLDLQNWLMFVFRLIHVRQLQEKPWGIKDPRMSDILGLYLSFFNDPKIIYCYRDMKDTIASFVRCYPYDEQQATNICTLRNNVIARLLKGRDYLFLDFTNHLEDDFIKEQIREKFMKEKE